MCLLVVLSITTSTAITTSISTTTINVHGMRESCVYLQLRITKRRACKQCLKKGVIQLGGQTAHSLFVHMFLCLFGVSILIVIIAIVGIILTIIIIIIITIIVINNVSINISIIISCVEKARRLIPCNTCTDNTFKPESTLSIGVGGLAPTSNLILY